MNRIRDCKKGTDFLLDLAGWARTGNGITIYVPGILIKSVSRVDGRLRRRGHGMGVGSREVVDTYSCEVALLCLL